MAKIPGMFDAIVEYQGIKLEVDPINRPCTEDDDNVMAIFYEEQPFMWEFTKNAITRALQQANGSIDFLDVGTGSGFWAIMVGKHTDAEKILAIDINPRAVYYAKKNARRNGVACELIEETYTQDTAGHRACKVIGIYPPYHLYPEDLESRIPLHARGGPHGQQEFMSQLCTATHHLAEKGIIIFNMMCLGRGGRPMFAEYVPQIFPHSSLKYTNIFPPTSTRDFLTKVYQGRFSEWVKSRSYKFPELYFCDGIIKRDDRCEVTVVKHRIPLHGRSWDDRIQLHREIAKHALQ